MRSSLRRVVAGFAIVGLGSVVTGAPASATQVNGVGTAGGAEAAVRVQYGDIIESTLLGENNRVTIDPANGTPTATQTLSPLTVRSVTLPALDALTVAPVSTSSTGARDERTTTLVDLGTLGVPGVAGTVNPASLSSLVDANGASSALTSTLADVNVLGLLGVDAAELGLSGVAGPTGALANRSMTIDAISVVDLQAFLNLFGLDIGSLNILQVADLLDQLGEIEIVASQLDPVLDATIISSDQLLGIVDDIDGAIGDKLSLIADTQTDLGLLDCGVVPVACSTLTDEIAALQADVVALDDLIDLIFQTMVDVLAGTPLLAVDGVSVGAVALATDTVANSTALVNASIDDIRLGGIDLGGVSADATLAQVEALSTQITDTLNTVLGTISPPLANVLSVELLQRVTNVTQSGDYVNAVAGITAVSVTVTPPDVCDVIDGVFSQGVPAQAAALPRGVELPDSPVTDVLGDLGSTLPVCESLAVADSAAQSAAVPEGMFAALTGPIQLEAASVFSTAQFKSVAVPAAPAPAPELPRTGVNTTLLLGMSGLLAAAALGMARVAAPARVNARRN